MNKSETEDNADILAEAVLRFKRALYLVTGEDEEPMIIVGAKSWDAIAYTVGRRYDMTRMTPEKDGIRMEVLGVPFISRWPRAPERAEPADCRDIDPSTYTDGA